MTKQIRMVPAGLVDTPQPSQFHTRWPFLHVWPHVQTFCFLCTSWHQKSKLRLSANEMPSSNLPATSRGLPRIRNESMNHWIRDCVDQLANKALVKGPWRQFRNMKPVGEIRKQPRNAIKQQVILRNVGQGVMHYKLTEHSGLFIDFGVTIIADASKFTCFSLYSNRG